MDLKERPVLQGGGVLQGEGEPVTGVVSGSSFVLSNLVVRTPLALNVHAHPTGFLTPTPPGTALQLPRLTLFKRVFI